MRADDTNKLETHATLGGRVEDDEGDQSDLLKVAVGIALTIGAVKAASHVQTWWKERRAKKVALSEAAEPAGEADTSDVATLAVAAFASEVEVALNEQRTKMSSAEAQRRVLEIMLAAAVIADNIRALSSAQVEDGARAELQSAPAKLTVPQVTDSLNRMLEADGTLLCEQASADLMRIFGGGCAVDGQYMPCATTGSGKLCGCLGLRSPTLCRK
ncbi:hypothetical protein GCM10009744_30680 [Kribbella alba]|uniref:Uncharacterized protein n=1 Tax=Kribbella alba TaxID=190197 RepID=A0ABP4RAC8_9ACTN